MGRKRRDLGACNSMDRACYAIDTAGCWRHAHAPTTACNSCHSCHSCKHQVPHTSAAEMKPLPSLSNTLNASRSSSSWSVSCGYTAGRQARSIERRRASKKQQGAKDRAPERSPD